MGASGHCVEVSGYRVINVSGYQGGVSGYRSIGVGYLGMGEGRQRIEVSEWGIRLSGSGVGVLGWGIGVSTLQVLQPRSGGGTLCISEAETLGTVSLCSG